MNQETYRKLISGKSAGVIAVILRFFLATAAVIYLNCIRLRNFLYNKGWLKAHYTKAVVISVGNITVGGTGKTPLVIWLYNTVSKSYQCAILTRGYKATQNYLDEPAILNENCPQAKLIVNPDRVTSANEAVSKFNAQILIMDDGFQHRRLARDLDIVAIDATCPFGYGKLLPAGLLREPVDSLKRAAAAIITRADQVSEAEVKEIEDKLRSINPDMSIARAVHSPVCVKSVGDKEISLEELRNKKIFAFCGIGNPQAFLDTIKSLDADLVGSKIFNDHYQYTDGCLAEIREKAKLEKADFVLTTQKDWTKIRNSRDRAFAYLVVELRFISGQEKIKQLIDKALAGKIPQ